jgi:hypothetical protein
MQSFLTYYEARGHIFGQCMSRPDSDLMYVNIPKNASSWTKPNLEQQGWEIYNYHTDNLYHKTAMVVLRDPVERWVSGIAEFLYLYHRDWPDSAFTKPMLDLIFDKIAFDDHTERQGYFLEGLDLDRCVFFKFGENYKKNFSNFLNDHRMPNNYYRYEKQHVSDLEPVRKNFKSIMTANLKNEYLEKILDYFRPDYQLIKQVEFYEY